MSTFFYPTKTIKLSQLQSICKKYDELELVIIDEQISESSELDDCGSPIKIDEKNFTIQSNFKKDITYPHTEYKDGECNFIIVNCLKDHSTKDDYYVTSFRMSGSDPYHIVKIIQYETEVVINDEYTIDDFKRYEHFGTEDFSKFEGWSSMSDEEKEPFITKLTKDQKEEWWIDYGEWIEDSITFVENNKTLSENERKKKLDKLWYQYQYLTPKQYLKDKLETV